MIKTKLRMKWKIIFFIVSLFIIFLLYSRFIGTNGLIVKEYKIIDSNLPDSFYGLKIVHFSDLHYGNIINEKVLNNLVDKINLTKPDIIIFTGDLIDYKTKYKEDTENTIIKYLSKIKSTYGNYYVNGEDDNYRVSFDSLMGKCNFISLNNGYDIISSNKNEKIYISGISADSSDTSFLNDTLDYFKIFVMHYPDDYEKISRYNFDLILSGHSHNGQIKLPLIGGIIREKNAKKYYDEYYYVNNSNFYISGGIGNSNINLRSFNTPSFNLYRLVDK